MRWPQQNIQRSRHSAAGQSWLSLHHHCSQTDCCTEHIPEPDRSPCFHTFPSEKTPDTIPRQPLSPHLDAGWYSTDCAPHQIPDSYEKADMPFWMLLCTMFLLPYFPPSATTPLLRDNIGKWIHPNSLPPMNWSRSLSIRLSPSKKTSMHRQAHPRRSGSARSSMRVCLWKILPAVRSGEPVWDDSHFCS